MTAVRKGQGSVALDQDTFRRRFRARFFDPLFEDAPASDKVDALADIAWEAYHENHKGRVAAHGILIVDAGATAKLRQPRPKSSARGVHRLRRPGDGGVARGAPGASA